MAEMAFVCFFRAPIAFLGVSWYGEFKNTPKQRGEGIYCYDAHTQCPLGLSAETAEPADGRRVPETAVAVATCS
jgi:hypothetical protein